MELFRNRGPLKLRGDRVSFHGDSVTLSASLRQKFPTLWVLMAYDSDARRLTLITATAEEEAVAYPVDRRGRIHCGKALESFGLARLRGRFRVEGVGEGQLTVKLPWYKVRRRRR